MHCKNGLLQHIITELVHGEALHKEVHAWLYLPGQVDAQASDNIGIVFLEFAEENLVNLALVLLRLEALLDNIRREL